MQPRSVLDVGQCVPDHASIRRLLEGRFAAEVVQAHGPEDALSALRSRPFDLVLINRKLDRDYSDGMEILKAIKADPAIAAAPVMLVTNYAEYEAEAVASGAEPGFGKASLDAPQTHERLARFLGTS